jgi:hypothetical protein
MKNAHLFLSKGMGDGLLFFTLANNLAQNGYQVIAYHDFLFELQPNFPNFLIQKYPRDLTVIDQIIEASDCIIINGDEREINQLIQKRAKSLKSEKTYILYPSTTKGKIFLGDYRFSRQMHLLENLKDFCVKQLKINNIGFDNGFVIERKIHSSSKIIAIHATSSDITKNWPKEKYFRLYRILEKNGYRPIFCFFDSEKSYFSYEELLAYSHYNFHCLNDLVTFLQKSYFFVGNDSGIGHLASLLKLPTITVSSNFRKRLMWRPFWQIGKVVTPYRWIINCKKMRLREKYWHHFIEVWRVYYQFCKLKKVYERNV